MNPTRLIVCVNQRLGAGQKSCAGSGSKELIEVIKKNFKASGVDVQVVEQVCLGRCAEGIAMRIAPGGQFFTQVNKADVTLITEAVKKFSENI